MKLLFACGSHPRHAYLARALHELGLLSGLIIEDREIHTPTPPGNLSDELSRLFQHHFQTRRDTELRYFSNPDFPKVQTLKLTRDELNGEKMHAMIGAINPDVFISYGVHFLSQKTLSLLKGEAWNVHGGLSPWYRGCITHFWPSYLLEPQMTGMTLHDLTNDLDAGSVVHQNAAPMVKGDGLHDVACRAVSGLADELGALLELLTKGGNLKKHEHQTSGRIWRASDWQIAHLKLIYDVYHDRIVDEYLAGNLAAKTPPLFRQF